MLDESSPFFDLAAAAAMDDSPRVHMRRGSSHTISLTILDNALLAAGVPRPPRRGSAETDDSGHSPSLPRSSLGTFSRGDSGDREYFARHGFAESPVRGSSLERHSFLRNPSPYDAQPAEKELGMRKGNSSSSTVSEEGALAAAYYQQLRARHERLQPSQPSSPERLAGKKAAEVLAEAQAAVSAAKLAASEASLQETAEPEKGYETTLFPPFVAKRSFFLFVTEKCAFAFSALKNSKARTFPKPKSLTLPKTCLLTICFTRRASASASGTAGSTLSSLTAVGGSAQGRA